MEKSLTLLVALLLWLGSAGPSFGQERGQPALPLPDPSPEEIAIETWSGDRPLSNSARAWHYNPQLVQPLLEVGDAVDDSTLTYVTRRMLAAVVAARNMCLY